MGISAIFISFLVMASVSRAVYVKEGELVQLSFPYPCESSRVTLRHGTGLPFYSSTNPESILPNYLVSNQNETQHDNCSVHLKINPVNRNDQGTFILIPYKNGNMVSKLSRIWLDVGYPPGKASCESRNEIINEKWVKIYCSAQVGSIKGKIMCYQNGLRAPTRTEPEEDDRTLNQILLASLSDPVYCCSSTLEHMIGICDCKDWGWNPVYDNILTDIPDSCQQFTELTPIYNPLQTITISSPSNLPTVTLTQTTKKGLTEDIDSRKPILIHVHIMLSLLFILFLSIIIYLGRSQIICCHSRGEKKMYIPVSQLDMAHFQKKNTPSSQVEPINPNATEYSPKQFGIIAYIEEDEDVPSWPEVNCCNKNEEPIIFTNAERLFMIF